MPGPSLQWQVGTTYSLICIVAAAVCALQDLVSPVLIGLDQLPDVSGEAAGRPMLFVGNHQKMGLYDMPLLLYELYMRGFKVSNSTRV